MKPISLTIQMDAYDCYLYGGYLFFIMRDGRVLYGSYPQIISRLEHKYQEFSSLIKIAFLRNDYYHSNAAKTLIQIPSVKKCICQEWERIANSQTFYLEFDEIEDVLGVLSELPSAPLDTKIYGMRLFVGCMNGMYEVRLCPDGRSLNPQRIEKCFDGKVIHLNAKYGEIVLSLGFDGLVAEGIDIDGNDVTKVSDKNVFAQRSHRTSWAKSDIMNYSTPTEFSYFRNTTIERIRNGQKKFWEKYETKQITNFATHVYSMEGMISKSGLKKEDIVACFNSQEKSFMQLNDGSIVSINIKEEENDGNETSPMLSTKKVSLASADMTKTYGRMLSGTTVPKGCAIEFFDKVVLIQNSLMQIIENQEVMKVHSFMNAYRFQDILSVTKQNEITLHALDTLDVSREVKARFKTSSSLDIDNIIDGLDSDYLKHISPPTADRNNDDEEDLPW